MNLRTLGGPLLAFASAAVMLGVIAGLAAFLIQDETTIGSRGDDFMGEYGIRGSPSTVTARPLADSYPFTSYFRLPSDARESMTHTDQRGEWVGIFLLTSTSGLLTDLEGQARAAGAQTRVSTANDGFTLTASDIQGAIQLVEGPGQHFLMIALLRYPEP